MAEAGFARGLSFESQVLLHCLLHKNTCLAYFVAQERGPAPCNGQGLHTFLLIGLHTTQ